MEGLKREKENNHFEHTTMSYNWYVLNYLRLKIKF